MTLLYTDVVNDTGRDVEAKSCASGLQGVLSHQSGHSAVGLHVHMVEAQLVSLPSHVGKPLIHRYDYVYIHLDIYLSIHISIYQFRFVDLKI